jgi:ribonuclease Z
MASAVHRKGSKYWRTISSSEMARYYYKPTPSVRSRNNYFPGSETLGKDEMRISFVGSCPFPPRRDQAGTCIMVELGNGDRFFFDFGPGCVKNILAMGVSVPEINDIFITHLHVDHYHDLSYLLPFSAWAGRWKQPLRVTRSIGAHAGTRNERNGCGHEADAQMASRSL